MDTNHPQRLRLSTGTEIAYRTAGSPEKPPILLLHGFPSSSRSFRKLLPRLSHHAHLIAPDLPGFGVSELLRTPSFSAFADAVAELLDHLHIGPRYIYLHDFGAPVGLEIAMRAPKQMLGLIIQNANAHETGQGEGWAATKAFWRDPTVENEAAATAHLTLEGTRDQYTARVPSDIAARIDPRVWEEDWRVMQLPGRMAMQRALVADYGRYTATFSSIAMFLAKHQPTALMIWGRHDAFFDLSETLSWMRALPRMEAHILDAGHFALETHAPAFVRIMTDFLARTSGTSPPQ
jgi:pimeloyl-ACP methyl ester carboxylesterase